MANRLRWIAQQVWGRGRAAPVGCRSGNPELGNRVLLPVTIRAQYTGLVI